MAEKKEQHIAPNTTIIQEGDNNEVKVFNVTVQIIFGNEGGTNPIDKRSDSGEYIYKINFRNIMEELSYETVPEFANALCVEKPSAKIIEVLKKEIRRDYRNSGLATVDDGQVIQLIEKIKRACGTYLAENSKGYAIMADSLFDSCYVDKPDIGLNSASKKDKSDSNQDSASEKEKSDVNPGSAPEKVKTDANPDSAHKKDKSGANLKSDIKKAFKNKNFNKDSYRKIVSYANGRGQKDFFVFLSAITNVKEGVVYVKTSEYKLAQNLKVLLDNRGIGAFWWEDPVLDGDWLISSKIAAGLAFSSVFIGLAFDTAVVYKDEKIKQYKFECLDENKNVPNCFAYEVKTFNKLAYEEGFDRQFTKYFPFKNVPTQRKQLFFYKGDPDKSPMDEVLNNKVAVNNCSGLNEIDILHDILLRIYVALTHEDNIKHYSFRQAKKSWLKSEHYSNYDKKRNISEKDWFSTITEEEIASFRKEKVTLKTIDSTPFFKPYAADKTKENIISLNENIEAVPTDYFFEYAIVDEKGVNAKEHFTVFPEKRNTAEGNAIWNIKAVVKDWNYAEIELKKFKAKQDKDKTKQDKEKEQDLEKAKQDLDKLYPLNVYDYVYWRYDGDRRPGKPESGIKENYEKNGGTFVICNDVFKNEENGKIHGEIVLQQSKDNEGNVKRFYCAINFVPKKVVHYNISDTKAELKEQISGTLDVDVIHHADRVPCLKDDADGVKNRVIGNKKSISDLSAANKYRLRLIYDSAKKYYQLLPDISEIKAAKEVIRPSAKCPCCGKIIKSGNPDHPLYYCYGESKRDGDGRIRRYCSSNYLYDCYVKTTNDAGIIDYELQANGNVKADYDGRDKEVHEPTPVNRMYVPDYIKDGAIISLVGDTQTGKSTFIAGLFGVHNEGEMCAYISNALQPYVKNTKYKSVYGECRIFDENKDTGKTEKKDLCEYKLRNDYRATVWDKFVTKTPNTGLGPVVTTHTPFILELDGIGKTKNRAFLSFFDVPGGYLFENNECLIDSYSLDATTIDNSDCIILLVNGTPKQTVTNGNKQDVLAVEAATNFLHKLGGMVRDGVMKKDSVAIAVVLCKFDDFMNKFDENSYVRSSAPTADDVKYAGSDRQKYIDICSNEVESYIKQNGGTNFLNELKGFKQHKFFAVSSIGRADSVVKDSKDREDRTVFLSNPINIENVIIWLSYAARIIE